MQVLSALLGLMGLAGWLYALVILTQLSRKLGAVTKMAPYFRGYYVAGALGTVAVLVRLLRASVLGENPAALDIAWVQAPLLSLLGYYLPLAAAATISLAVTWRYWGWLLRE